MKNLSFALMSPALVLVLGCAAIAQRTTAHAGDDLSLPEYQLSTVPDGLAKTLYERTLACWPSPPRLNAELSLEGRIGARSGTWYDANGHVANLSPNTVSLVARLPLYSATEIDREYEREAHRRRRVAEAVGQLVTQWSDRQHVVQQLGLVKMLESRAHRRVLAGIIDTSEQVRYMEQVAHLDGQLLRLNGQIDKSKLELVGICVPHLAAAFEGFLNQHFK